MKHILITSVAGLSLLIPAALGLGLFLPGAPTVFSQQNASPYESFGRKKITPSHNTVKSVVAITATCIHIRKIGSGEVTRFAQPGKNLFYLIVHTHTNS
jgi:hypothetical protein